MRPMILMYTTCCLRNMRSREMPTPLLSASTTISFSRTRSRVRRHRGIMRTYQRRLTVSRHGFRIIKPHGSINWLRRGNVPFVSITTDYRIGPVTHRCFEENRFEEPMIIPPTHLKQPLNIPETQAAPTRELLSKVWKSMADTLIAASRVFIIGYSFPSTDHHLRTLFYQVSHERRGKKYSEVHCCTRADGGQEGFVLGTAARFFPAECFHPHERGFKDLVAI